MRTGVKVGIGLTVFAGVLYAAYAFGKDKIANTVKDVGKDVLASITAKFKSFGLPSFAGNVVTLPTLIEFNNQNYVPISADRIVIVCKLLQGKAYNQVGTLDKTNLSINTGTSIVEFRPQIDLKALTANFKNTIMQVLQSASVDLMIDISVTALGNTMTQSVPYKLKL